MLRVSSENSAALVNMARLGGTRSQQQAPDEQLAIWRHKPKMTRAVEAMTSEWSVKEALLRYLWVDGFGTVASDSVTTVDLKKRTS